jgi:WD40 repeat protein/serine/threonine protein kinase
MVQRSNHCDPSRLGSLLNDQLPEGEQAELAEHLEQCATCRRTLEGLAAARPWWIDLRNLAGTDDPPSASVPPGRPSEDEVRVYPSKLPFLAPSENPEHLGRLGPYEVTEIIGQGGMGIVLKAHDPALHRVVAIKMLAPELATSAAARRRFAREAQAAAAVAHDHVVLIHAVDSAQGLPYLVMAYVPGKSLQERIDRTGPLEVTEILRIGMQAASGLAAAHAQGLVHRDVKPANILLENGVERVKLTDFGLARAVDDASLTQSGVVTGTPQYMAPEQARGEAVDHRADLFSLGSVLYAMCTGHSPFRAESTMAVLRRVSEEPARPVRAINAEIPPWLAAIIARLHAKDPAGRYQSAAEVTDVLGRWLAYIQQPNQVPPPFPLEEAPSESRPRRVHPGAIAALALLSLGTGLGATEATGVTHVVGFVATVLRITTPDGTLVLKVDDPAVKVRIDGEDVVITGAGPEEVRVSPGRHEVGVRKPGETERVEVVSISRGGKTLIDLGRESTDVPNPPRASSESNAEAELRRLREQNLKLEADLARRESPVDEVELIRVREAHRKAQSALEAARRFARSEDDPTVRRNLANVSKLEAELDRLETVAEDAESTRLRDALRQAKNALKTATQYARIVNDPEVLRYQEKVDQLEEAELTRLRESLRLAQDRWIRARELARTDDDPTVVKYQKKVDLLEAELARREPAEPPAGATPATLRKALRDLQERLFRAQRLARGDDDPAVARYQDRVKTLTARLTGLEPSEEDTAPSPFVSSLQPPSPMSSLAVVAAATLNPGSGVWCVTFAPDGKRVAAASSSSDRSGRLWVWELRPGTPLGFERALKITAPVRSAVFSPDGQTLACVEFRIRDQVIQGKGWDAFRPDLTVRDPRTGGVRTRIEGHAQAVVAVAFTSDGRRLITGSLDKTIRVWDLATGQFVRTLVGHDQAVVALAVAPDGRTLASGSLDQTVRLWDLATGAERRVLRGHTAGVESLAFSPDGTTLTSAGPDQAVRIWEVATGRLRATLRVEGDVNGTLSLAYAPDGQSIAAGTSDGTLMIWGVTPDDGMPLLKRFRAHEKAINSLTYSPDGAFLATGGLDDSVRLWDVRPVVITPSGTVPGAPLPAQATPTHAPINGPGSPTPAQPVAPQPAPSVPRAIP